MDSQESSGTKGGSDEKEQLAGIMDKLNIDSSSDSFKRKPVIIIVVGMAGSGKTTFLHRLVCHTQASNIRGYVVNLDPAVLTLPFGANIDIRDTVKYKEVMKQFNLGPNGGILTSLNLFATKFDEVISVIERRADQLDYVLVDTPGQIEIFTWSASGAIITEAFASTFPTVVTYVVDTPRSASPVTFMSNMLYACSILYKTRLPLVLAFNKIDVAQHEFALEWMEDFEAFQAAIKSDTTYTSTLTESLSLSLDEFYRNLRSVGVSAISGAGMNEFFKTIEASAEEFMENYKADLDKRRAEKQRLEEECRKESMDKLRKDMEHSRGETVVLSTGLRNNDERRKSMMDPEEVESEEEDDDFERFSEEDEDLIDEDEDEEIASIQIGEHGGGCMRISFLYKLSLLDPADVLTHCVERKVLLSPAPRRREHFLSEKLHSVHSRCTCTEVIARPSHDPVTGIPQHKPTFSLSMSR
ncbi:hypothetical protein V6N11_036000 [Hibiscus sabdariffa]|uniref:GPN-loop GTPase 1 n=1 Tax=Hibiscus sabdariffa TaxID=183260 RepID=A0ABR2R939_9ROSI